MKVRLVVIITFLMCMTILASTCIAANKIHSNVIIDGGWGKATDQFGRDYSGKTADEYGLNLFIGSGEIFILDSMKNRIIAYNNMGIYKRTIQFNTTWEKHGLYMMFTINNHNIYILSGKPPYYSDSGIVTINKYSMDGKYINSFGKSLISSKSEDFGHLFSNAKSEDVYIEVGGKKVLAIDEHDKLIGTVIKANKGEVVNFVGISPSGNPIVTVTKSAGKIAHTMVIEKESNKIIKTVNGRYSMTDDKGKFFSVRTLISNKRERKPMLTKIEVFDSATNQKEEFELVGDIRVNRNGKEKVYKLTEGYYEESRMDADGAIYHMLALNDGVVVRRITFK